MFWAFVFANGVLTVCYLRNRMDDGEVPLDSSLVQAGSENVWDDPARSTTRLRRKNVR